MSIGRNIVVSMLFALVPPVWLMGCAVDDGPSLRSTDMSGPVVVGAKPSGPGGSETAVQAVAGPGVTVTVRDAGQLAVSWSADSAAARYQVFQSAGGGAFGLVATVFDSSGGAPATSYIADGLTDGVRYCYAIQAAHADGSLSDPGAVGCGTAPGTGSPLRSRTVSAMTVVPENPSVIGGPGATMISGVWTFKNSGHMNFPVPVNVGEVIDGFQLWVFKGSGSGCTVSASLFEYSPASRVATQLQQVANSASAPGGVVLGAGGLGHAVAAARSYYIQIGDASCGANVDSFTDAMLTFR